MENTYTIYYNDNVIQSFSNEEEMIRFIINGEIPYRFIAIGRNLLSIVFCDPRFFCAYKKERYTPKIVMNNNNFLDF